ncbi:potassium channel family protein [Salipaludibacillus aurantiacus]|uniref:Potassium channel LctB n=1 Tax=Salipaludibacillus aurantiacus TaxID=1601833 RepID=A0A1H9SNA9_9BACI|nr:potassium channel family protein [Salipaludibacillus aurantiacus]SER86394.1 potassium channel LctB [Salipaludibacillus aurantiacus]
MESLLILAAIAASFMGIGISLNLLIKKQPVSHRRVSIRHFIVLILVYANVMVGFGVLYIALELLGVPVLKESDGLHTDSFLHLVEDVLYFSAVTLLTVGYGDIIPQGVGRWIAMIQALIGYLLPAAFVVTTFFHHDERPSKYPERL